MEGAVGETAFLTLIAAQFAAVVTIYGGLATWRMIPVPGDADSGEAGDGRAAADAMPGPPQCLPAPPAADSHASAATGRMP